MEKAIFVELDGIVRFNVLGVDSMIKSIGEIGIYTDHINKLRSLKALGFKILGFSNQPVLGEDLCSDIMAATNEKTDFLFDEIVWCNHGAEEQCFCKKPDPSLLESLISKYDVDIKSSVLVGKEELDLVYALNAGIGHFFYSDSFFNRG